MLLFGLFIIVLIFVVLFVVLYFIKKGSEKYDYSRENPNALISGKNIAGTVYSDDPNNTPGLGWI